MRFFIYFWYSLIFSRICCPAHDTHTCFSYYTTLSLHGKTTHPNYHFPLIHLQSLSSTSDVYIVFSSRKITQLPHNNVYLNKQVSHFILHFINEKFNTSQDLRLGSVQNRIAEIHIQSLRILLQCVIPGNLQQYKALDQCTYVTGKETWSA